MPSTFSTNLRLEIQATGENRGSWGNKANAAGFSLLEEAIAGNVTVAMTDANKTLTPVNGATDQARPMFIKFTGALTAGRTITIPSVSKLYVMLNSTTGGFPLTITTGSGTTYVLQPTGSPGTQWKLIYTDGISVWSNDSLITLSTSAQRWGIAPFIDATGLMEVGQKIDFHNTNTDANDWNVRLETGVTTTDLYVTPQGGTGRKIWNAGNMGAGSGLNADLVDGFHAADLSFPATTSMLFWQTAAPVGWTKVTTHNDKALRVVSGTVTSGGSVAFSAAFSNQNVGATTLSAAQMPSHAHTQQGTFGSGTVSADHSHNVQGNTGTESADHAHNTGTMYSRQDGGSPVAGTWAQGGSNQTFAAQNTSGRTAAHSHFFNVQSGGISANHSHAVTISGATVGAGGDGSHTHGLNIAVQYVDLIIATKN